METQQNPANEIAEIDAAVKASQPIVLTTQQQLWIDYNALSGIITDITGTGKFDQEGNEKTIRKMPITEFATLIGVHRDTLRAWRLNIPNFWGLVDQRRKELIPQNRVQAFHEKWYVAALSMKNWQISEAWAINFLPDYKAPKLKAVDDGIGTLLDALELARNTHKNVIEGEVVDADKQPQQNPNA